MAETKQNTQITVIDKEGNRYLLYPITKRECIEGMEDIDAHLIDTTGNPHQITAEMIGATPAGFGLGESNGRDCTDCNEAKQIGFYSLRNALNVPEGSTVFPRGVLLVEVRDGAICQTIRHENNVAQRYFDVSAGQWSQWEWVNPPMYTGVEYRTTERWAGDPVYTMLIEAGTMPNGSRSSVAYPDGIVPARVLRVVGQMSSGEALPAKWGNSSAVVYASRSHVYIETNDDAWSIYAAQVQVWYTK